MKLETLCTVIAATGVIVFLALLYERERTQTESDIAGYCLQYNKFHADGIAFSCAPK